MSKMDDPWATIFNKSHQYIQKLPIIQLVLIVTIYKNVKVNQIHGFTHKLSKIMKIIMKLQISSKIIL